MTSNRLLTLLLIIGNLVMNACSSSETTKAYDNYYGDGRQERDLKGLEIDSIQRLKQKELRRQADSAAAPQATAPVKAGDGSTATKPKGPAAEPPAQIAELLSKNICSTCHKTNEKLIGPPFVEIAQRKYSAEQIVELVHSPKPEHWPGYIAMAPLPHIPKEHLMQIAGWINSLQ